LADAIVRNDEVVGSIPTSSTKDFRCVVTIPIQHPLYTRFGTEARISDVKV